jgi:hypothetical protein
MMMHAEWEAAMKAKLTASVVVGVLLAFLLVAGSALAMSSAGYRMDWFVPLTGGGGPASSAHYAINLTVGQTVLDDSSSAHYAVGLGYWYGTDRASRLYLPIVVKN